MQEFGRSEEASSTVTLPGNSRHKTPITIKTVIKIILLINYSKEQQTKFLCAF